MEGISTVGLVLRWRLWRNVCKNISNVFFSFCFFKADETHVIFTLVVEINRDFAIILLEVPQANLIPMSANIYIYIFLIGVS